MRNNSCRVRAIAAAAVALAGPASALAPGQDGVIHTIAVSGVSDVVQAVAIGPGVPNQDFVAVEFGLPERIFVTDSKRTPRLETTTGNFAMPRSSSAFVFFLVALVASPLPTPAEAVVLSWYYGPHEYQIGTDTPCGLSGTESRLNGYAAQSLLPPNLTPAVGEIFYAKLVLGAPGNPCLISAVDIQLSLPSGVTTAISAANPVYCFARLPPDGQHNSVWLDNLAYDQGYGCPQSFPQGIYGQRILAPNGGAGAGLWGMAAGFYLEFLVPLTASVPQNGANSIAFRVQPDLSEFGTPGVPANVNSDVIFRAPFEDQGLTLDVCGVVPIAQGC